MASVRYTLVMISVTNDQIESMILGHLLPGLLFVILGSQLERLLKYLAARRDTKKFPVAGEYLTKYDDRGTCIIALAELKQTGRVIEGLSRELNREWRFAGEIEDDGYIVGRYYGKNVGDKGYGGFILKIAPNCDMHGYWFGKDPNERDIQHGTYDFLKRSVKVEPVSLGEFTSLLDIADKQLGEAYIKQANLQDLNTITLVAKQDGAVLGFGTARVLDSKQFIEQFVPFFPNNPSKLRPLQQRLNNQNKVGFLASVAVHPSVAGRGIGSILVLRCMEALRTQGVSALVATAWHNKKGTNAGSILHRAGFSSVLHVDEFWKADSLKEQYACPVCGDPPCVCSAEVYVGH